MERKTFLRNIFGAVAAIMLPPISFFESVAKIETKNIQVQNVVNYARFSKQMLRNIAFLQSWLPEELLKQLNNV